jgi:hypothetical protein
MRRRAGFTAGGKFQLEPAMLAPGFDGQEVKWFVVNGGMSDMTELSGVPTASFNLFAQTAIDRVLSRITEST